MGQKISLFEGMIVAVAATVMAVSLLFLGSLWGGVLSGAKLAVTATGLSYCGYLLSKSKNRTGRVLLSAVVVGVSIFAILSGISLFVLLLLNGSLIWLVRSMVLSRSAVSALLQGGVLLLGVGAGVWGLSRGGVVLGCWSFFLTQAICSYVPAQICRKDLSLATGLDRDGQSGAPSTAIKFIQAHRAAEAALDQIIRAS